MKNKHAFPQPYADAILAHARGQRPPMHDDVRLDVSKITSYVLDDVMANMGFGEGMAEQAYLDRIARMEPKEVFRRYLEWNGVLGFSGDFYNAVVELEKAVAVEDQLRKEGYKLVHVTNVRALEVGDVVATPDGERIEFYDTRTIGQSLERDAAWRSVLPQCGFKVWRK